MWKIDELTLWMLEFGFGKGDWVGAWQAWT
jgi:uncharacterized membrane protein YsdA (DUF1294 family)